MAKSDIHTWIYPWISISTATLDITGHNVIPLWLFASVMTILTDEREKSGPVDDP